MGLLELAALTIGILKRRLLMVLRLLMVGLLTFLIVEATLISLRARLVEVQGTIKGRRVAEYLDPHCPA